MIEYGFSKIDIIESIVKRGTILKIKPDFIDKEKLLQNGYFECITYAKDDNVFSRYKQDFISLQKIELLVEFSGDFYCITKHVEITNSGDVYGGFKAEYKSEYTGYKKIEI